MADQRPKSPVSPGGNLLGGDGRPESRSMARSSAAVRRMRRMTTAEKTAGHDLAVGGQSINTQCHGRAVRSSPLRVMSGTATGLGPRADVPKS